MKGKISPKKNIKPKNKKVEARKATITRKTKRPAKTMHKNDNRFFVIFGAIAAVVILAAVTISVINKKSYEEYDLKGLTIKEACEKARSAGWEVSSVQHIESFSDTTDCHNDRLTVTNYDYWDFNKAVVIYFGEKGEKKAECEASGKWYRDNQCKSQEEWENDYAWKNAHAACKKYGSSGYAKTLTDCYLGNDYVGPVNGDSQSNPTSSSSNSSGSSSNSNSGSGSSSTNGYSWRQMLSDYESWVDKYVSFMKRYNNTTDYSSKLSMLNEYNQLMTEMTEWTQKVDNMDDNLTTSDLTEYLQTLTRINQKMQELY